MEWNSWRNNIDITYLVFVIIGFGAIAYLVSIKTALFLIIFLTETASAMYLLMNVYLFVINKWEKKYLKSIALSISIALVLGCLLYYYYGLYSLLRALSISIVLFIGVMGYNWITKKNS